MTVTEKIEELRRIMKREDIAAYIISGTDPHNSEYLPAPWQQRKWISGFTGSFGTVVVTQEHVGLWTDTRYFIQAEQELAGTEIKLHKLRVPDAIDYPQWLYNNLDNESRVGIDGFCMAVSEVRRLQQTLESKNIKIVEKIDLLGEIWLDRPALPVGKLQVLTTRFAGETAQEKIAKIQKYLVDHKGDYILFTCLDEIAWLFNIRCHDIAYNPVAISYALVDREKAHLFIKPEKITAEIGPVLQENGIECHDYHHLSLYLDALEKGKHFLVDSGTCNFTVYNRLVEKFDVIEINSPITLMKAIKNPVELDGFRRACKKDAIALTKFFYWLEHTVAKQPVSELEAARKLEELRRLDPEYVSDSFECISAYGANAALPHYTATEEQQAMIHPKGLYLVDSGGQYLHGTTDITRTMPLGETTSLEKTDYTLVLKGMINLSQLIFPKGTKGCNIDIIARQPLYMNFRNFGHGTGHGVGYYLNVHEGPQSIRPDLKDQEIMPGMVTSNEPGLYREGSHGIRHENLIVCQRETENEFGEFYSFETITCCYFDTSALVIELLTPEEKTWLNQYNQWVYREVASQLTPEEQMWLKNKTQIIK